VHARGWLRFTYLSLDLMLGSYHDGVWIGEGVAGWAANLLLALGYGGAAAAYALCAVLRLPGDSQSWLPASGRRGVAPGGAAAAAEQGLLLLQLPPLLCAGLLLLAPLWRDCARANASLHAARSEAARVRPAGEDTSSKPSTPVSWALSLLESLHSG
jgi:hypothetical protein